MVNSLALQHTPACPEQVDRPAAPLLPSHIPSHIPVRARNWLRTRSSFPLSAICTLQSTDGLRLPLGVSDSVIVLSGGPAGTWVTRLQGWESGLERLSGDPHFCIVEEDSDA